MARDIFENGNSIKELKNIESANIDLIRILRTVIRNWWVYLIFLLISLSGAYAYIKYSTPLYKIQSKILVKDKKKGGDIPGAEIFQELDLFDGQNSVENEVELLKSRTLMEKTLIALQLNIRYFERENFISKEIYYKRLPFVFHPIKIFEDSLKDVDIIFSKVDGYKYKIQYEDFEKSYEFLDTVDLPVGRFVLLPSILYEINDGTPIHIRIKKIDEATATLQQSLQVEPTTKTVSTIDIAISDPIAQRGEEILNMFLNIYDQLNKEDKNRIADSTIAFIDDRLKIVVSELAEVEGQIQGFRQENELMDISSQGKMMLENSSDFFKQLTQQDIQIDILKSLEDYLKNEKFKERLVPTALTIQDPTLLSLIQAYNNAQIEKDHQLHSTGESNPVIQDLNYRIINLKSDILNTLSTIKRGMIINRDELKNKTQLLNSAMRQVPGKEKTFLEFSRQQSIKEELYLYLLKKREETAVSKSANVDNARIVDSPKGESIPFKPQKAIIYFVAVVLGILIPTVIVYLRNALSRRLESKTDITTRTNAPILGILGHSTEGGTVIVKEGTRSVLAEQFRALRTNLQYAMPNDNQKCILVTSSMGGEGKSFTAINLANIIAITGKRVVLIELDLRKPKVSKALGLSNRIGFSNYAINKAEISDILISSELNENLLIIPSGPIPPNPTELILLPRIDTLFKTLKSQFDYVIVDTPPLGLVTDAQLLAKYADCCLFIVRQGYTFKHQLSIIDEEYYHRMPKLNIVVNDMKAGSSYGYSYRYEEYHQNAVRTETFFSKLKNHFAKSSK